MIFPIFEPDPIEIEKQKLRDEDLANFTSEFQSARNILKHQLINEKNLTIENYRDIADVEKANTRLKICKNCEFYVNRYCIKQACLMESKTQFVSSVCPINIWNEDTVPVVAQAETSSSIYNIVVNIDSLSNAEKVKIIKLANNSLNFVDSRFVYNNKQYSAYRKIDGSLVVKKYISMNHSLLKTFSQEEITTFESLVEANANTSEKTFEYKNYIFNIKLKTDGDIYIQFSIKS